MGYHAKTMPSLTLSPMSLSLTGAPAFLSPSSSLIGLPSNPSLACCRCRVHQAFPEWYIPPCRINHIAQVAPVAVLISALAVRCGSIKDPTTHQPTPPAGFPFLCNALG